MIMISMLCNDRKIGFDKLIQRGIKSMEVSVAEAPNQLALFRCAIPQNEAALLSVEKPRVRRPVPCSEI